MVQTKERTAFTISEDVKQELEKRVPKSERSRFVEAVIAEALNAQARRKATAMQENMPKFETRGIDSVSLLRKIRRERQDYVAGRHQEE